MHKIEVKKLIGPPGGGGSFESWRMVTYTLREDEASGGAVLTVEDPHATPMGALLSESDLKMFLSALKDNKMVQIHCSQLMEMLYLIGEDQEAFHQRQVTAYEWLEHLSA